MGFTDLDYLAKDEVSVEFFLRADEVLVEGIPVHLLQGRARNATPRWARNPNHLLNVMEEVVAPAKVVALNDVGKIGFVKVFAETKPLPRGALTCALSVSGWSGRVGRLQAKPAVAVGAQLRASEVSVARSKVV
ncbi:hypothetical protein [Streptomyces parvulus]|uniref:hypothetical protein n=1 Tax=Streptomyces parvulus TaxID=146923 RepID=UPI002109ACEE|nr:hypothetical protein [Streptomyces parvulus]MCQ4195742.1 hypothetical protein [Streptomyces parvulus]